MPAKKSEKPSPREYKLDPENARVHEERDSNAVRESLEAFGAGRSIVVDSEDYIVAGNSTYEQAKALGIPVIEVETEGEVLVAIKRKDLTKDDERRIGLALADNRTQELSRFDPRIATGLLERIRGVQGIDLKALAFDSPAFRYRERVEEEHPIDPSEELLEKWGVKRGQVWEIPGSAGTHRVMCGDATDEGDVVRLLDGATPYLMVTDPPYGVNYDPNWRNEAAAKGQLSYAAGRVGKVTNDDREDWGEVFRDWPCSVLYAWSPGGDHIILTGSEILAAGFEIRNQIIWSKPHSPISRGHYRYRHEPCWYAVRKGAQAQWIGPPNADTVWNISLDRNVAGGHSTQKPLECMAKPIRHHEGDVCDPFLGSGTTGVAAEQEGRVCFGMEIEPKYVAVTLERLEAIGLTPKKVSNRKPRKPSKTPDTEET